MTSVECTAASKIMERISEPNLFNALRLHYLLTSREVTAFQSSDLLRPLLLIRYSPESWQ